MTMPSCKVIMNNWLPHLYTTIAVHASMVL